MLIERPVCEQMQKAYPQRKINNFTELPEKVQKHLYSLFEQENIEGEYLSSDYSFCRLWRNIGGKVYADLSITLSHHGSEDFSGNLMEVSQFQTKFPPSSPQ
ncbi:MAG TPA: hypothetical protein PLD88_15215, partial [Candidatus Berkiella sp.]|nr:hypothetical protein [Candidatus Berkiella sp.]